jgi:hypothetical protein
VEVLKMSDEERRERWGVYGGRREVRTLGDVEEFRDDSWTAAPGATPGWSTGPTPR